MQQSIQSLLIVWFLISITASLLLASVYAQAAAEDQKLFFAFGDSYADTGNSPKSGPNEGSGWLYPYGITWPQYPAGRFSDGKVESDFFADLLGIPTPPPYLYLAGQSTTHGVNFATVGSGVTFDYGTDPLGGQVDNLELFLRTDPYSKLALANSLTLVAVNGNDYTFFSGNSSELFVYIQRVVAGIGYNLQRLYDMGLRDVMVSNLLPVGCLPVYSKQYGYRICDTSKDSTAQIHNAFLLGVVEKINSGNPGARFVILDQYAAFGHLFKQAKAVGFTDGLVPCCRGLSDSSNCGDTDPATGKPLYTVCKHRGKAVFWDTQHPTMWAWNYIFKLYTIHPEFLLLADEPTLLKWLRNNAAIQAPVASPMPQPDMSLAVGQVQQAVNALLPYPNYSESLALLESVDLTDLLGQTPAGVVTIFLPNNQAYTNTPATVINRMFSEDLVNEVALHHVVESFWDYNTLLSSRPSSLTTLSDNHQNLQLHLSYTNQLPADQGPPRITVVAGEGSIPAHLVQPNLYVVPGEIAIHGIDHLLIPPAIM